MKTIVETLSVLSSELSYSNLRILSEICKGIFRLGGKVTGLNISRYTDKGGSYRNIQRFFLVNINWLRIRMLLFSSFLYSVGEIFIMAADECTEGKAGKFTFGIGYFYSSISQKVIRSISFLHIAFLSVNNHDSYSVAVKQITKKEENQ